jgi:hypothetical protein
MMDDSKSSENSSQPQTTNTTSTPQAAGDPAPAVPLSPEELAAVLLAKIDEFEALVPNFQHHDKNDARRVSGIARFARELIVPTIATVTSFEPAAERNMFDVERSQMAMRRRDAFAPVIQRLSALTDGVQFTVNSDLAESGSQALNVYSWAKSYVRRPDAAKLHPYVSTMAREVKRVLNHRKPPVSESTPAPSGPAPAPTPGSSQLPPGSSGFLASNLVVPEPAGEAVGDEEYPDYINEALDRAVKE